MDLAETILSRGSVRAFKPNPVPRKIIREILGVGYPCTLLALDHGLGTCPEVAPVVYPDVIREVLGIPNSKLMVMAIALGYLDWDDAVNQFLSETEPLQRIAKWYDLT